METIFTIAREGVIDLLPHLGKRVLVTSTRGNTYRGVVSRGEGGRVDCFFNAHDYNLLDFLPGDLVQVFG